MKNLIYPAPDNEREWLECVEAERMQECMREFEAELSPLDDDLAQDCGEFDFIGEAIAWEQTRPSYNELILSNLTGGAK